MSNPQIQTQPNPTETSPIRAVEDMQFQVTGSNVIQFPVPEIPGAEPSDADQGQGEIADPADPVNGVSRVEVASSLAHQQYVDSKERIENSIQETKDATVNELYRQAQFISGDNRDEIADKKSEKAFDNVSNLVRPAGTRQAIGQKVLKIVEL